MKRHIFFFSFLCCLSLLSTTTLAQSSTDALPSENSLWPDRTTRTLAQGRKVCPLFGVKKMGVANNMEWRIQPIFFFISPNIGLKKYWGTTQGGLSFSTVHQLNYPSLYLNIIAREGAGGVLPEDSAIPPIISLRNEFLLGLQAQQHFITLRLGIATAFNLGNAEKSFPDIDFPFLYNRTLAFNHTPNFYLGINYNKDFLPKLNVEADIAAFLTDTQNSDVVFESQLLLFWKKSDKFGLKAGLAAAHGTYPYGKIFQLLPLVDMVFGFGGNEQKK